LRVENRKLIDRGEEISMEDLRVHFGNATFIIQEKLKKHPAIIVSTL
jgi:hypothetical protein